MDKDLKIQQKTYDMILYADKCLKQFPIKKYEIWSKKINEIGRMLGGWMKSTKK